MLRRARELRLRIHRSGIAIISSPPQAMKERQLLINVIDTNKTDLFFREREHFTYLQELFCRSCVAEATRAPHD